MHYSTEWRWATAFPLHTNFGAIMCIMGLHKRTAIVVLFSFGSKSTARTIVQSLQQTSSALDRSSSVTAHKRNGQKSGSARNKQQHN